MARDRSSWSFPGLEETAKVFLSDVSLVMTTPGDAMTQWEFPMWGHRQKYTHQVGCVGKVKFVSKGNHPYTGIFKGSDTGIVRLSSTTNPETYGYVSPSMALKFLIDGGDSANLVSMYGLDGQPDEWNFFQHTFTNNALAWSNDFQVMALANHFKRWATDIIQAVGCSNMAVRTQDGSFEKDAKFPFSMTFVPDDELKAHFPNKLVNNNKMGYMDQLKAIPANHKLYKVMALDKPKQMGGKLSYIGDLVLDGKMTSSKWGDENLFFRHQKMDDDLEIHPEWKPYVPLESLWGKCPYKQMMESLFS